MTDSGPRYVDDAYWEDRESARKLAPVYVNRAFVEPMGEGMLRINLGQINDEGVDYYTSIVVTAQNAVAIAHLIARHGNALLVPPAPQAPPAPAPFVPPPPGT